MISATHGALLAADDPSPVMVENPSGRSPFLLIGDHAGNAIPSRLGDLGVPPADRERHVAWDIGVRGLGRRLAQRLDAVFISQTYSRLVIDCNRAPGSPGSILAESDGSVIRGNLGLTAEALVERRRAVLEPYQVAIAAEIARRAAARQPTILIALHSFTPRMAGGAARPWQIGILYSDGDISFARCLLEILRTETEPPVGDNEPYRMDETDYTVPLHAFAARLPYAELEVRQDLLGDAAGIERWASIIAPSLEKALSQVQSPP